MFFFTNYLRQKRHAALSGLLAEDSIAISDLPVAKQRW
jgi:hypothetical protein